jgi:hypothetical protein
MEVVEKEERDGRRRCSVQRKQRGQPPQGEILEKIARESM